MNNKINLYYLKSKLLNYKYKQTLTSEKLDYCVIKHLKKYMNNLKSINNFYTLADIEELKNGKTTYPEDLYKNELKNRYMFFACSLGYIDNFLKNNNQKLYIEIAENLRNKILSDFNTLYRENDPKILYETILSNPCFNNFNNCIKNLDNIYYNLQFDLMEAYYIGYKNAKNISLFYFYNNYNCIFNELNAGYTLNSKKVEKARKKYLKPLH